MKTGTYPGRELLCASAVFILTATSAAAIPSPELVIGSAVSISQFFAFATALIGGGAVFAGSRNGLAGQGDNRARKRLVIFGLSAFIFAIALAGLNVFQFQSAKQDRLARLQATLNRPAVIVDNNLRETSFSAQSSDSRGISTQDAAAALAAGGDVLFVDVRETAEHQMGTIPGAQHIRFPDVDLDDPQFKGRQVVLLCHNGNRSSETCERLAALGIDCRFIVGGIEKWIVEGRSFTDETVRTLSDLRAIPEYENKDVLLDTSDVADLFSEQDVQFIDVRYPLDFAPNHLPDAINLPMRATPTAEIVSRIAALPDKPIVAACYDRRGCFISQVLGYELTKAGYDFRGRYTLPWEYFVPKATKPHVALWLAEQNQSYWQRAISGLALALNWLAEKTHFLFAVFALALTTRVAILPVAIKAERDQIVTARVAPELEVLKQRFKDDPAGKPEALKTHYAKHGLSPGRNLLVLLFLPFTMLGISAVQKAGVDQPGVGWLTDMGSADPSYVLPALATTLGCLYLQLSIGTTARKKRLSWIIGFPVLGVLVFQLSAAGSIYLIFALILLFVQRAYVTGLVATASKNLVHGFQRAASKYFHRGLIPLTYTGLLGRAGNKALRLSQLANAGFPVPAGVVLDNRFLESFAIAPKGQRQDTTKRIASTIGSDRFAVRSSASAEDGENLSFAGVFESRLDVPESGLEEAIKDVAASFIATHTQAYADGGLGNILIQRMVQPDYAGVLFTADPTQPGIVIVEFAQGNAENLVSGRIVPTTLRFGRSTGALLDAATSINFSPLLEMGKRIEDFFGSPQDIEWTVRNGAFEIVQSRNITTLETDPKDVIRQEWAQVFNSVNVTDVEKTLLEQDEMSEVLPRPTPLSLSYMQALWSRNGSVGISCANLGIRYNPGNESHLTTVFGRLYSDTTLKTKTKVQIPRTVRKWFNESPQEVANNYQETFLPKLDQRMAELAATDFGVIEPNKLAGIVDALFSEFISDIHVEVETINIAAGYFVQRFVEMCDAEKLDAASLLAGGGGVTPSNILRFVDVKDTKLRRETLLNYFGHRAPHDYELSAPRYRENAVLLNSLLAAADAVSINVDRDLSDSKIPEPIRAALEVARSYQSLKDAAKHQALRHLAEIRRALEALDYGFGLDGLVYYLSLEELAELPKSVAPLRLVANDRRILRDKFLAQNALPAMLTAAQLEASAAGVSPSAITNGNGLMGRRVSGDKRSEGLVYKATRAQSESGEPLQGFQSGDILVCSFVHPNWLPQVLKSGGVIAEVGGWLSHIAIVARENHVALVVGITGWDSLAHGAMVAVELDGQVEAPEPASSARKPESSGVKVAAAR